MSEHLSFLQALDALVKKAQLVDLSYTLEEGMPAWPTQARYSSVVYESYEYGDAAIHAGVSLSEHTGTHIDAPRHFFAEGCPVDRLPLAAVMGRGVVINADFLAPREAFSLEALEAFEKIQGEIKAGDVVMFRFGWDTRYALQPDAGPFMRDWPGLSPQAAHYLLNKKVAAVGTDALSLDAFGAQDNPCHHILLGNGIPILENLCNLSSLPSFCYVIGLPNKFKEGSGSPIRMVALVE